MSCEVRGRFWCLFLFVIWPVVQSTQEAVPMDEEDQLAAAIALSLGQSVAATPSSAGEQPSAPADQDSAAAAAAPAAVAAQESSSATSTSADQTSSAAGPVDEGRSTPAPTGNAIAAQTEEAFSEFLNLVSQHQSHAIPTSGTATVPAESASSDIASSLPVSAAAGGTAPTPAFSIPSFAQASPGTASPLAASVAEVTSQAAPPTTSGSSPGSATTAPATVATPTSAFSTLAHRLFPVSNQFVFSSRWDKAVV